MALARRIIGGERLALAIAKLALAETTLTVSPKDVATVLEIDRSTASRHIDAIGIKNHDAA
jgi:DNA-binding MarR family transcriptional regulator